MVAQGLRLIPWSRVKKRKALLIGLTTELTRVGKRKRSPRQDRALVVSDRLVVGGTSVDSVPCPLLDAGTGYVVFGGNGGTRRSTPGAGYRIIGSTYRGWLARAGYFPERIEADRLRAIRQFLGDLQALRSAFQLTVAAFHGRAREWRSLDDLLEMTDSRSGRDWVDSCVLRVYAPEDYLTIWRRHFAACLGFSYIPGGEWTLPPGPSLQGSAPSIGVRVIRSAGEARQWLHQTGWDQQWLARALRCSEAWVSQQLSGSRRWSQAFQAKLNTLARQVPIT